MPQSKSKQIKALEKERDLGYKKIAELQLSINKWSRYIEIRQEQIIKLKGR